MNKNIKRDLFSFFVLSFILLIIGYFDYPFFFFVIELIIIFIGAMIFIVAVNASSYTRLSILKVIGGTYLAIALLDLSHFYLLLDLSSLPNLATKSLLFWTSARMMEASCIFIAILIIPHVHKFNFMKSVGFSLILITVLAFVILNEYVDILVTTDIFNIAIIMYIRFLSIILLFVSFIVLLFKRGDYKHKGMFILIILFKVFSEILLLDLTNDNGFAVFGHTFKFVSYSGLYVLFVSEIINSPYDRLHSVFIEREQMLINKAERDLLTKVYNHTTTFVHIENRINELEKDDVGLIMIDIDDFKAVNDLHGHLMGDEVLVQFSKILLSLKENDDVIGRYGGDEFIYLIDQCSSTCIERKVKLIQEGLQKLSKKLGVNIETSFGACVYEKGDSVIEFIRKADIKLYESKASGKNRLTIWEK